MQDNGKEELSGKQKIKMEGGRGGWSSSCTTKCFLLKQIPQVEKHEIQRIIAQGGSSFPLTGTILAGRLDIAQ